MSVFLQPIYTQTVGAGGASSITFNNIPQTFTDLVLLISARNNNASGDGTGTYIRFNGNSSGYSYTGFLGDSGTVVSARTSSTTEMLAGESGQTNLTAGVFGNSQITIPNYTAATFKQVISDGVNENNGVNNLQRVYAGLWQNTSPITSLSVFYNSLLFTQYSTFSLYGVLQAGI
jgi:hypothetical protein